MRDLVIELTKARPRRLAILTEGAIGRVNGQWLVVLRDHMIAERESWVLGHELCHWWFKHRNEPQPAFIEPLADAVGARLVAPGALFRSAVDAFDHRIHALAKAFHTTQALALMRVAETVGRSAVFPRVGARLARGAAFDWPEDLRSVPRSKAHPIKVDGRIAMIVARCSSCSHR